MFYNADLLDDCNNAAPDLSVNAFIDDTTLYAISPSTEENCRLLKLAHNRCLSWAHTHRAIFALSKYQLIHLSRKKFINKMAALELGPHQIIIPKIISKLLGIILDSQLTWKPHIEHVKNKTMKSLAALARLGTSTWGGSFLSLRQIYLAVVLPQLSYACSVWYLPPGKKRHQKSHLATLELVQTKATRIITSAYKATSSLALNIEAGILPLKLHLELLIGESLLRLATSAKYLQFTQTRSKRRLRKVTPLEALAARFEPQWKITLESIEKIAPFITPPWADVPKIHIEQDKT